MFNIRLPDLKKSMSPLDFPLASQLLAPIMQVDAELAPFKAAKREEALRRVDDEVGVEARVLKEQVRLLR